MTFATILAIVHSSHKNTSSALYFLSALNLKPEFHKIHLSRGTFSPQALNLAIAIDLVVLKHSQLGLLALMLYLFRGGVDLLLALLRTTT